MSGVTGGGGVLRVGGEGRGGRGGGGEGESRQEEGVYRQEGGGGELRNENEPRETYDSGTGPPSRMGGGKGP